MLFHHDPLHNDGFLDRFLASAVDRWDGLGGGVGRIELAAEQRELAVGPTRQPTGA
jgi:hypothetical protein